MLKQIFSVLAHFGSSARTTGCVFILADPTLTEGRTEIELSPQSVGVISDWASLCDLSGIDRSFDDLKPRWDRFRPTWRRLLQRCETHVTRGELDVLETAISRELTYEPDRHHTDERAQQVLEWLLSRVDNLVTKLESVTSAVKPASFQWFLRDAKELLAVGKSRLAADSYAARRRAGRPKAPPSDQSVRAYTSHQFPSEFDRFVEDAFLMGNMVEHQTQLLDLLRLDIWSSRPQLYEVWILVTILSWLSGRGYQVQLLGTEGGHSDLPFRWNLSYAKSSRPCALIRAPNKEPQYLFYQLYRTTGDMPDISLMCNKAGDGRAIWSVDAKHSEAGGYGAADYRRTAERYRDSFGAPLSLVVEYFDRNDLGLSNPTDCGSGAHFIHRCSPGNDGLDILFGKLAPVHPVMHRQVLCIDFSSSFASRRDEVLLRLRSELGDRSSRFLDEVVCFAGSAECRFAFRDWLSGVREPFSPVALEDGTRSQPLFELLERIVRDHGITELIVVTDGQMDVPIDQFIDRVREKLCAHVYVYPGNLPSTPGGEVTKERPN
jgi:hypothetical protein